MSKIDDIPAPREVMSPYVYHTQENNNIWPGCGQLWQLKSSYLFFLAHVFKKTFFRGGLFQSCKKQKQFMHKIDKNLLLLFPVLIILPLEATETKMLSLNKWVHITEKKIVYLGTEKEKEAWIGCKTLT